MITKSLALVSYHLEVFIMSQNNHIHLIELAAKNLKGKQIESDMICCVLQDLCTVFDFDDGLVYDRDQYDQLILQEHIAENHQPFHSLTLDDSYTSMFALLAQQDTYQIISNYHNNDFELSLLHFFSAQSLIISPVVDENSKIYSLIILSTQHIADKMNKEDITTLKFILSLLNQYLSMRMYQNKISFVQTSLESILDHTGIDIYVNDFYTHDILYVNKSMAAPYGGPNEFKNRKCWQVLFPGQSGPCDFCPQKKLIDENNEPTKTYTWDYQRAFDGSWFRVFSSAFRWIDGRLAHVVSSADITDNKKNEALIEYMANYDSLTNLPNRRMLVKECEKRINQATKTEKGYLLFFDIDGFKQINDQYGHDAGDEFLIQLGEFFSNIPLLQNAIYRNGGDEFVAIIGGEDVTKANIKNLAHFIHQRFYKPWNLKAGEVYCNTSIGVACYPDDGNQAERLLSKADQAMYHAKKQGAGNICFFYQMEEAKNTNDASSKKSLIKND